MYLSLSLWEGIGVANMEALCSPIEVALSNIPPHIELSDSGNLVLLDLSRSSDDIAAELDLILEQYGQNGSSRLARARRMRSKHDVRKMVKNYHRVYKSVFSEWCADQ